MPAEQRRAIQQCSFYYNRSMGRPACSAAGGVLHIVLEQGTDLGNVAFSSTCWKPSMFELEGRQGASIENTTITTTTVLGWPALVEGGTASNGSSS